MTWIIPVSLHYCRQLLCLIVPRCIQDNLSAGVAGVTQGDYRMDGKMELITATTDGESKQSPRSY